MLEDHELIAKISGKDREAFKVLFYRYHKKIFAFLMRLLKRPELADEVVNDTMLVVWEKAAAFEGRSKASTWILGIAYRKGLKLLNREDKHPTNTVVEFPAEDCMGEDLLSDFSEHEDRVRILKQCMQHLSESHRTVVELTYYFGLSNEEVASVVDCPLNTVKTRLFNARKQMRKILEEQSINGPEYFSK